MSLNEIYVKIANAIGTDAEGLAFGIGLMLLFVPIYLVNRVLDNTEKELVGICYIKESTEVAKLKNEVRDLVKRTKKLNVKKGN